MGIAIPRARRELLQQDKQPDKHSVGGGTDTARPGRGQGTEERRNAQPLAPWSLAADGTLAGEDPLMMAMGLLDAEQERVDADGKRRIRESVDQKVEHFTEEKQFRPSQSRTGTIQCGSFLVFGISPRTCPRGLLSHTSQGQHSGAFS